MSYKMVAGNEAVAFGAMKAGVGLVSGYPGTPSTEILETIAKHNDGSIYVEWSTNEKAGLEVAAGASFAGARALVTMKQVGLNVASDPLMSLNYLRGTGGLVIAVCDDPAPGSSQTEQDTRHFGVFGKFPVFDPSSPEEVFEMIQAAFECSEKYKCPVILRPATRICHSSSSFEVPDSFTVKTPSGYAKDNLRIVFPKRTYEGKLEIIDRLEKMAVEFSDSPFNFILEGGKGESPLGIVCGGVAAACVQEAIAKLEVEYELPAYRILKVGTPHPFPSILAKKFAQGINEVMCFEELDPVLEREMLMLACAEKLDINVCGKLTKDVLSVGETTTESCEKVLRAYFGLPEVSPAETDSSIPQLFNRPPVLCAGCPHRASFYAVKQAMKHIPSVFCGDIGCYTLGNAQPLDMVDCCLCMGADITLAQGIYHVEPNRKCFSFIGDSTFFASGITGVANAVYNNANIIICVLDNSTTAMTGHQPHPGIGRTMMGDVHEGISTEAILRACGVNFVETVNPFNLDETINVVKRAAEVDGCSAIIFKAPCASLTKPSPIPVISDACKKCRKCVKELGCPALSSAQDGTAVIDNSLCHGCSLCASVCPFNAIVPAEGGVNND